MTGALPLSGRCVAVTRPRGKDDDALTTRLRELGATVLAAPAVAIVGPADPGPLDQALRALGETWLVAFASAHAVEHTVARAGLLGLPPDALGRPLLAAVGSATAARLAALVRPADLVPEVAGAAALAALVLAELGPPAGRRVLLPRAEEGRPELAEALARAGAEVVAPTAYRTVPSPPAELEPLHAALARGALHAVCFASPSAVRAVLGALPVPGLLAGVLLASIGPTTSAELRAHGRAPDVEPAEASGLALAEALARRLAAGA